MAKCTVCLINPPTRCRSLRPPHGLMYISSYLTKHGVDNYLIDPKGGFTEKTHIEMITDKVKELAPDFVGISMLTTDILCVFKLLASVKHRCPGTRTVVGGLHPTLFPEEILRNDDTDVVVMGEGEETMYDLVRNCSDGLGKIKGIGFKKNGEIVLNEKRPMIKNIDDLPFPAFDKIDMDFYLKPNIHILRGIPIRGFNIFSNRGCPFRCRFCVNKNIFGGSVRFRSPERVVDEIEYLHEKYNIDGFYLYEDTFGIRKNDVEIFCDEINKRRMRLVWGCTTRVNLVSDALLQKISQAGCMQIDFGVESGSQRLLDLLKKDITLDQVRKTVALCRKHRIRIFSNFMINLPTETEDDFEKLLSFSSELKSDVSIFNIACPFPGTDIQDYLHGPLTTEDYVKMSSMASFNTFIDFLESKCKLSSHSLPIRTMLERIGEIFPLPRTLGVKFNSMYLRNFLRLFSFILNGKYLKCLLRSTKKRSYLLFAVSLFHKNNVSTTSQ